MTVLYPCYRLLGYLSRLPHAITLCSDNVSLSRANAWPWCASWMELCIYAIDPQAAQTLLQEQCPSGWAQQVPHRER